ncbi:MAG TPA: S41 family peptidase [Pyrinomonadaceae bacterium]|nr:S41 family peptidase [Pyrinomonadaceae bacterium]
MQLTYLVSRASVFLLFIVLSGYTLPAQSSFDANQPFTPEQLIEDVDFYLKTLEEAHVNPYAHISAKELRTRADDIKARIRRRGAMTQKEFWLLFTPLVSALQDSHSYVIDPRFFIKAENDTTKYFPIRTVYIDGKIVVENSFADEKVEKGAIITGINGISSKELIRKISGHRFGVERERVENAVLWLWVGAAELFGRPEEFTVSFSGGRKIQVKGLSLPEFVRRENAARSAVAAVSTDSSPLELKLLGDGAAYLNSTTFSDDLEKYKEILREVFTKIKTAGVRHLIIDVRSNRGGNSALGDALIDMFNSKPYRHYSSIWKRSNQYVEEMKRRKISLPDSYLALRPGETLSGKSPVIKPGDNPLRFQGQVYVLSAKETFSSGQMFLAVVKDNGLAKIIGEETTVAVCSFGEIMFFNLPHSRLRASVSTKSFTPPAGCKDARGVLPDIAVERCVSDYVTGRDAILVAALNLIKPGGGK